MTNAAEGAGPDLPPLLSLADITKRFGGVVALEGVDFDLRAGEVHALVGENGAGKSTLMKIIAGVHGGYEGTMRLDGETVRFRHPADALKAGIGMVHQELSVAPDLSVAENVFLGVQPTNRLGLVAWRRMARDAREQLGRLGLDLDPKSRLGDLPIGLQQLVELARVLFSGARIVILDEPTSALSPPEIAHLFEVLKRLKSEGRSFVFISHFLEDVLEVADRVTVFRNGRRVATADAAEVDKPWLIRRMIGEHHEALAATYLATKRLPPKPSARPVLEVEGLGLRGALEGVSFTLFPGEVLGVYGFVGSGQPELARALFGKVRPDRGAMRLAGRTLRPSSTAAARAAGLALVPESRRAMLFADAPVYKNISIASLHRLAPVWLRPERERALARRRVEDLGIRPPDVDRDLGTLSGGNQQKVALGRWLEPPPKVLILAEPTRGMDVGAKEDVVRIVRRLRDQGLAVIVLSSEPETILSLADRVIVLRKGQVVAEMFDETIGKDRLLEAA